jgi:hypothetical protein
MRYVRLCEKSVHGSLSASLRAGSLTTNGCQTLQIKHLAVRSFVEGLLKSFHTV